MSLWSPIYTCVCAQYDFFDVFSSFQHTMSNVRKIFSLNEIKVYYEYTIYKRTHIQNEIVF